MRTNCKIALGTMLLVGISTVCATPISGLGAPSGNAALSGGTEIGFDSTASGTYTSLTLSGVTVSSTGAPFSIGTDYNGFYNNTGGKSLFNGFDLVPDNFRFDFAAPVSAFAFNWGAADNIWTLRAFDSGNNLLETLLVPDNHGSNSGDYFGIATAGIAYATLIDTKNNVPAGDYVFIDRFTYAQGVDVPEPDTWGLFALGLCGLALARRRRLRI